MCAKAIALALPAYALKRPQRMEAVDTAIHRWR